MKRIKMKMEKSITRSGNKDEVWMKIVQSGVASGVELKKEISGAWSETERTVKWYCLVKDNFNLKIGYIDM